MSVRTRMVLLATVGTLAAATGIGYAAIPHSQSAVISGCYEKRTGILRVLDAQAGKSCTGWELPLSWNQQGAQGLPGAPGPAGAPGPKGDKGDPGEPAPLYSAGTGLALVGTEFQLAFDPATQSELDAETSALRAQVTQLETDNQAQSQQIAVLQAQINALNASLQQLTAAISVTGSHVTVNRSLHVTGSISNPRTTIP